MNKISSKSSKEKNLNTLIDLMDEIFEEPKKNMKNKNHEKENMSDSFSSGENIDKFE
jgi:hypothetical protein